MAGLRIRLNRVFFISILDSSGFSPTTLEGITGCAKPTFDAALTANENSESSQNMFRSVRSKKTGKQVYIWSCMRGKEDFIIHTLTLGQGPLPLP